MAIGCVASKCTGSGAERLGRPWGEPRRRERACGSGEDRSAKTGCVKPSPTSQATRPTPIARATRTTNQTRRTWFLRGLAWVVAWDATVLLLTVVVLGVAFGLSVGEVTTPSGNDAAGARP